MKLLQIELEDSEISDGTSIRYSEYRHFGRGMLCRMEMLLSALAFVAWTGTLRAEVVPAAIETVPHELDCLVEGGHVQGASCDESGIYLSHAGGIVKVGWDGKKLVETTASWHLGDCYVHKSRLYGAFGLSQPRDGMRGWIGVWDATTLKLLEERPVETNSIDGIAVIGDRIYYGIGAEGTAHYGAEIGIADLSLRKIGVKHVEFGYKINYGVQTMATDGTKLFCVSYVDDVESNPKRHNCALLNSDLKVLRTFKFGGAEGFGLVPPAVFQGRNKRLWFKIEAMGGNMQGWRRDPVNNPPRIRISFCESD